MYGFIGLGDMGRPMVRNLLREGHEVLIWNRSKDKLNEFAALGAHVADSPAAVAASCEVVGICLTSHEAVEEVCFGLDGLLSGGKRAESRALRVIVDFSTGAPDAAQTMAERALAAGVSMLDAPVSGGPSAAEAGSLTVLFGGDEEGAVAATALLRTVAGQITRMGPPGSGQTAKLCNQLIVACNILAIAEAFALARKAGIVTEKLSEAMRGGFADSRPLQVFGPRMAGHVFQPRLGSIGLMGKDVRLSMSVARRLGACAPMIELADTLFRRACDHEVIHADGDLSQAVLLFEGALSAGESAGFQAEGSSKWQ